MNKKDLSRFDKTKDTIKMENFICQYLNNGIYIDCRRLTHKQLKLFDNPYVVSIPFQFAAANTELILSSKILLVYDSWGNIAPYINPLDLKKIEKLNEIEQQIANLKKTSINQLSQLVNLWGRMQLLLYEKNQIEETIAILEEIDKYSKIEQLGGKKYVKKY